MLSNQDKGQQPILFILNPVHQFTSMNSTPIIPPCVPYHDQD